MLTVNIICVGKLKENYLRDACFEYIKRLAPFCKINIIEIGESRLQKNPSDAQIALGIEAEGDSILAKTSGYLIPLCIEGKQVSSTELAAHLEGVMCGGLSEVSFIIGGSHGLSPRVKSVGGLRLSMSAMTFPHQLARVMLLEQVYRATQILNNTKYHK